MILENYKVIVIFIVIISLYYLFFKSIKPNTSCISLNNDNILNSNIDIIKISEDIVYIENIFNTDFFNNIKSKTLEIIDDDMDVNRNFLRQNKTISSTKLQNTILYNLYMNKNLQVLLSSVVNKKLKNVDCDDLSWGNIISYSKPGDNILWHYDPNHYKGSRFTVLIMVNNKSTMDLVYVLDNKEKILRMKENSLLIFNGSKVLHKTTKLEKDQKRDLISYTYCDTCESTPFGNSFKYVKEKILGYY